MASNESVVLLLGKVGGGKSTFGNFLLGEKKFDARSSFGAVTKTACTDSVLISDRKFTIIDTPGLLNAAVLTEEDKFGFAKIARGLDPVPNYDGAVDIVFYVQSCISRISAEEDEMLKHLRDNENFDCHVIPVFSRALEIGKNDDEQKVWVAETLLKQAPPNFKSMMTSIRDRIVMFDSELHTPEYQTQKMAEIMQKVKELEDSNQGKKYTMAKFQEALREETEEDIRSNIPCCRFL